jgi:hypothetical protein
MMMLIILSLLMQIWRRTTCNLQKDRLAASHTRMIYLSCKFLSLLQEFLRTQVLVLIGLYASSDEGFVEPPLKNAKATSNKLVPAASETAAPATTPAAQLSTASSVSKEKEISLTAVAATSPPPSGRPVSFLRFPR